MPWVTLNQAISFLQSAQVLFSGLNSERGDKARWVFHKIVIYPVDSAVYLKTREWETPITIFKVPIILLEFLKDVKYFLFTIHNAPHSRKRRQEHLNNLRTVRS